MLHGKRCLSCGADATAVMFTHQGALTMSLSDNGATSDILWFSMGEVSGLAYLCSSCSERERLDSDGEMLFLMEDE